MSPARSRSKSASKAPPAAAPKPAKRGKGVPAKPKPGDAASAAKIVLPGSRSASEHLAGVDADWAALVARVGPCELPLHESREPYEALVKAIAHQQLHGKAAQTILHRFTSLFPGDIFPSPERVLQIPEESIRSCGFSGSKTAGVLDVCRKAVDGVVPSRAEAESLSDEELIARLVAVRGVGRWTVEMLLIFSLGRPDVLPVDDFGVREGFRILKGLPAQPKPKALAEIGLAWAPHRSAAAWYLWRAADAQKETKEKAASAAKPAAAKKSAAPSETKKAAPSAKASNAAGVSSVKKNAKKKDSKKR